MISWFYVLIWGLLNMMFGLGVASVDVGGFGLIVLIWGRGVVGRWFWLCYFVVNSVAFI